eukprot:CAMPEP_0174348422 /NCGR_PEP_ID=MMETSP0811_2-20130205/4894_1 /TAXON_ID=73025 ORGANISM="Eutreptiella gymnastica-like, Strain CCMP1594" /NCGR_SAMPLE_ID=MMETSP0811_2 /ASSEMBLY_ACC=CAM_ASM_000667 /LENGTH=111 /DNA_ID=CAMNT_0015474955 /DNA_START=378 /DNA_END=714 /DNA_ORIENTATION=-
MNLKQDFTSAEVSASPSLEVRARCNHDSGSPVWGAIWGSASPIPVVQAAPNLPEMHERDFGTQPFLCSRRHPSVAVPAAFPGTGFSSSSLRVMPTTTSLCGTMVALDASDP